MWSRRSDLDYGLTEPNERVKYGAERPSGLRSRRTMERIANFLRSLRSRHVPVRTGGRVRHCRLQFFSALEQCSSQMNCPVNATSTFYRSSGIRGQLWRVDALLVVEVVLAAVIVGIGAYGQRYRHHQITRFLFLGATTLFLPIISSVATTISRQQDFIIPLSQYHYSHALTAVVASCDAHVGLFVILASLVQVVMINTSTIVSVDDTEGQCKYPPLELVVQGIWTFYLAFGTLKARGSFDIPSMLLVFTPYALLCTKIALKYYAFERARRSIALGRNPGLVFVYMQQLQAKEAANQHFEPLVGEGAQPPPLLVMRESEEQVEKHPNGYAFKDDCSGTITLNKKVGSFVTIDRVWQLDSTLMTTNPWLKDLCLSFALFKLLRCRFAGYKLTNSGSAGTVNFFRSMLLKAREHDRVFGIIMEELSFVHDYYYSSLPISYSKQFLPILSIFLSLFTICYGMLLLILLAEEIVSGVTDSDSIVNQLGCQIWCSDGRLVRFVSYVGIGRWYFDLVPLLLVLVLAVTAEVWDMASYICSNWTKVTLICRYINHNSSSCSLCMQKWVSILLRCRCKLMKHWDEKMSLCSVLVPHPKTTPIVLVYYLLSVPDQRRKVKVPEAVKVSIINAVRSVINGRLSNGAESLQRSQFGESFLWACNGKGTSDIILIWHIATSILEAKHPYRADDQEQGSPPNPNSADDKIVATHLSKYCAYLVSWCPELLPDKNNAWSKSLYKAVKKDAKRALAGHAGARSSNPEDEYQKLVHLLSENSKHEVLKNGVKLGKQLVETINDEEIVWKLLADFWSEMILYVAPSDNHKGHSEAIARGGELITLLWAMLFHAGIVSRPGEEDGAAAASSGGV